MTLAMVPKDGRSTLETILAEVIETKLMVAQLVANETGQRVRVKLPVAQ